MWPRENESVGNTHKRTRSNRGEGPGGCNAAQQRGAELTPFAAVDTARFAVRVDTSERHVELESNDLCGGRGPVRPTCRDRPGRPGGSS